MGSESFCLRWNDFEANLSHAFREIQEAKDFLDVTLVCEDEQLKAHKLLLSACSPVLYKILQKNPHQNPLIYLKGVRFTDVEAIVRFMYHGEVSVAQDELSTFLEVAEDLQIRGLTAANPVNATPAPPVSPVKRRRGGGRPPKMRTTHRSTRTRPSLTEVDKVTESPPSKRTRNHPPALSHTQSSLIQNEQDETKKDENEGDDVVMLNSVKSETYSEAGADSRSVSSSARSAADVNLLEADVNIEEEGGEFGASFNMDDSRGDDHVHGLDQLNGLSLNPENLCIEELAAMYLKKNEGGGGYECTVCGRRVRDRYAAQDHLECQHFPSFERYTCDICGKKLNARKLYLGHKGYCSKMSSQTTGE